MDKQPHRDAVELDEVGVVVVAFVAEGLVEKELVVDPLEMSLFFKLFQKSHRKLIPCEG